MQINNKAVLTSFDWLQPFPGPLTLNEKLLPPCGQIVLLHWRVPDVDERKHSREKTKWKGSLPALCCRATNSSVTSCQWKRNKSLIKQCDSRHPAQPTDLHGYQCPSMHCLTRSSGCDTKETKEENLHKFNWFWQQILPRLQLIFSHLIHFPNW